MKSADSPMADSTSARSASSRPNFGAAVCAVTCRNFMRCELPQFPQKKPDVQLRLVRCFVGLTYSNSIPSGPNLLKRNDGTGWPQSLLPNRNGLTPGHSADRLHDFRRQAETHILRHHFHF